MNILFFLTPKHEVDFIYDTFSMKQALDTMEQHRFSAVPIINEKGKYIGTINEGDLLWYIKKINQFDINASEQVKVKNIKRKRDNLPVSANSNMEDLIEKALVQNFVPVVDDNKIFIGIIKRKDIIKFCYEKYKNSLPFKKK